MIVKGSPEWRKLPCSNCIKSAHSGGKGLSEEEAGRRSSNYYCRSCNAEYQRTRYQRLSEPTHMVGGDLDSLDIALRDIEKMLSGPPNEEVGGLDLADLVLILRTNLNILIVKVRERAAASKRDPGRPKKAPKGVAPLEDILHDLRLAIQYRVQNPTDNEPRIVIYRDMIKAYYDYNGPEMQD